MVADTESHSHILGGARGVLMWRKGKKTPEPEGSRTAPEKGPQRESLTDTQVHSQIAVLCIYFIAG